MKQLENYTIRLPNILSKRNTSGYIGVSWFKPRGKWRATIKGINIGYFKNKQDAIESQGKAE